MRDKVKILVSDCGKGCDVVEPYGFVPEAGCRYHDKPEVVNTYNEIYGRYFLEDGEVFVSNNTIFKPEKGQ